MQFSRICNWQKQSPWGVLQKNCSKKFCKIDRKRRVLDSPLIKSQAYSLQLYQKKTLVQVFSFEFYKNFDNAYWTENLRTTLNWTLIKINGHKTWQRDLRWNEPEIALAKCIKILLTITEIRETEAAIRRCSSKWVFCFFIEHLSWLVLVKILPNNQFL